MIGPIGYGLTLMLIFVLWFTKPWRAEGGFNHGVMLRMGVGPQRFGFKVHNPKWWMLWAHVMWMIVRLTKKERGIVTMTQLKDGLLHTHHLRVYRSGPAVRSRSDERSE